MSLNAVGHSRHQAAPPHLLERARRRVGERAHQRGRRVRRRTVSVPHVAPSVAGIINGLLLPDGGDAAHRRRGC